VQQAGTKGELLQRVSRQTMQEVIRCIFGRLADIDATPIGSDQVGGFCRSRFHSLLFLAAFSFFLLLIVMMIILYLLLDVNVFLVLNAIINCLNFSTLKPDQFYLPTQCIVLI
jgi:hypothetical protein